ncbi:MAG: ABC transporter ATP-binding protein [Bacteroidetes bacterium]|jgi:putative ABC transport system ATP-binding protein|nr:ABC transporter ATP-binding protein [Bacteroidota bacterium]
MALIDLKDIYKIYQMGSAQINALDGLDCQIEKGEYVALMGPSGSGKSTLMNIIGCLDTPSKGIYSLNGTNVSDMSDDDLASIRNVEIGFVFQSFNLLPRTSAIENVSLPLVYAGISKNERMERAQKALEKVGLGDRADHKPNELSGGQRQRVAIARALINNPSIVLADEPTGNLDSKSSLEIMNLFGQIHQDGNTVVMVTHEEDIAKYAKRTIRMIDGKLADQLIVN